MDIEIKQKLEKLKKENKIKIARKQLIDDLNNRYHINISNKEFIDYQLSESIYKKIYERIREEDIIIGKFYYEYDSANKKIEELFTKFNHFESNNVLYYISTVRFDFSSCKAIKLTIVECRDSIFKLIHEIHDDLIVVDENLKYGFIISNDEYQYVSIEYWGV